LPKSGGLHPPIIDQQARVRLKPDPTDHRWRPPLGGLGTCSGRPSVGLENADENVDDERGEQNQ